MSFIVTLGSSRVTSRYDMMYQMKFIRVGASLPHDIVLLFFRIPNISNTKRTMDGG